MRNWPGKRTRAKPGQHMNKLNSEINNANQTTTQALGNPAAVVPEMDAIYLGLDLHAAHIRSVRQLDQTNPQRAQRLTWENIEGYCLKQLKLAKKVYAVYEAGAFGFGLCRRLRFLGIECYVVHPHKLDSRNKGVQTDQTDALALCQELVRYVAGNKWAMHVVHVPTEEQEAKRVEGRHRKHLQKEKLSMAAHGRGLLLFHGIRRQGEWWIKPVWEKLRDQLTPQLRSALEDCRKVIQEYECLLDPVDEKLEASAPKDLPVAMGKLTFVLLMREVYNWYRFKNRRQVGSFTGLCGGVASSGPSHYDLGITKTGSSYVRTLLIEMAWRMVFFQPNYRAVIKWQAILTDPKAHRRHRKRAIVALARQLAVDIWKWQTGRVTAEQLGWRLTSR